MKKLIYLLLITLIILSCKQKPAQYIYNQGEIFGTYYHFTYLQPENKDLKEQIESELWRFNASLSTFDSASTISRINKNDTAVRTDAYFEEMYATACQVSEKSQGAFDITVAPLVNAWGFGFGLHDHKNTPNPDSILPFVGYNKIKLENHRIIKQDKRIMLDASAIAKGQGCDMAAKFLEKNGCLHFLVEIGGEVACKGVNPKGEKWRIGIDLPKDDPANESGELQTIVQISNVGLATSGNYRQFYYKNGKKYAHTINPITGFPVEHNLLSATVIAPTCMQADAYATAFMVLGVEKSLKLCSSVAEMDCYLIYTDESGALRTAQTKGFSKYIAEKTTIHNKK